MKWRGRRQSENVEDCQGMSPRPAIGGGAILLIAIAAAGTGGRSGRRGGEVKW